MVSAVSSLDPNYIISSKVNAEKKFKKLVEILYERDWITSIEADNAKQQFFNLTWCAKAKLNEKFEKFTKMTAVVMIFVILLFKTNLIKIFGLSSKLFWFFHTVKPLLRVVFQSIAQLW